MFHEEQKKATAIDEELDALYTTAAAAAAVRRSPTPIDAGGADRGGCRGPAVSVGSRDFDAQRSQPWWETDPVIGARYGSHEAE